MVASGKLGLFRLNRRPWIVDGGVASLIDVRLVSVFPVKYHRPAGGTGNVATVDRRLGKNTPTHPISLSRGGFTEKAYKPLKLPRARLLLPCRS